MTHYTDCLLNKSSHLRDTTLAQYVERGDTAPGVAGGGAGVVAAVLWPTPATPAVAFTMLQSQISQAPALVNAFASARSEGRSVLAFAELLDVSTNADLLGVFIYETAGSLGFDGIALAGLLDRLLLFAVSFWISQRSKRWSQ